MAKSATCTSNISTTSQLGQINSARPGAVVCVAGSLRADAINITASGTAASPITYQFNGATFKHLEIHSNNVVIDNFHLNMQGIYTETNRNEIVGSNITIQNGLFENGGKVLLYVRDVDNLTITNNVIRNAVKRPYEGSNCIAHAGGTSVGFKLIHNEISDCASDGLQLNNFTTAAYPKDVEIAYNDIYITPALYVQGGNRACAENAIDLKGGTNGHVHHNELYGFRPTQPACSGTGDDGHAIKIHEFANNWRVDTNNMYNMDAFPYGQTNPYNRCIAISSRERVRNVAIGTNICKGLNQGGPVAGIGRTERPAEPPSEPIPGALQFVTSTNNNVSEGAGAAGITVSRTGGSTGPVSVGYTTRAGGTATEGADYSFTSGVLTWADGDAAAKTFSVPVINDADVEGNETVSLALSIPDGGATIGTPNAATLTILDDEQAPTPVVVCGAQAPTIVGTAAGETITGTTGADVIYGLEGNDLISALDGNDIICGGDGNDTLQSSLGTDQAYGEIGDDIVRGGDGSDKVDGGAGTDQVFGDQLDDALTGGTGTDRCDGGTGTDTAATCETVLNIP